MKGHRMRSVGLWAAVASLSLVAGLAGQAAGHAAAYQTLLGVIPSTPGRTAQIWINDYAAAAEVLGISRPGPEATDSAVEAYLLALDRGGVPAGPFISGFHQYAFSVLPGLRERSGYDVRDVRASLQDLALVPVRRVAVILDLAAEDVRQTILRNSAWPTPEQREHNGVAVLVWDPVFRLDFERRLDAPVFDELGRVAPLAFAEEGILSASSVEDTEAMIDAHQGLTSTLWDADTIRALAEGLARLGAYSCVLTDDPSSQSVEHLLPSEQPQLLERADVGEALRPYEAFGVGVGKDANGLYMAIVLVHTEEAAATENASLLPARLRNGESLAAKKAPWSTWFDVERTAIELNGSTLLAKVPMLPTSSASMWVRWLMERDPLLLFREE